VKKILVGLVALAVIGGVGFGVFRLLTRPSVMPASVLVAGYTPNLANGETIFNIGGCVSCHKTPGQDDRLKLGGGVALASPFGTFYGPNISPDPEHGIGRWSEIAFLDAVMRGVGDDYEHLYPALPYTSYQRMTATDVRDLYAYMKTLPAVSEPSRPHDVPFPFTIRRALGLWKILFLDEKPFVPDSTKSEAWNRGAYLVEGPGHCAECHSPRNLIGGIETDKRFSGGPDPEGKGFVPNITPSPDGIGAWSEAEIAEFLKTGFTPEFDSAGGSMAEVIQNTARLTDGDRAAMASYIASLPPRAGRAPAKAK
jgi:mono/diheme cytochrome c family protein